MPENQPENFVYRILDAAINRAGEGLRVVEDYLRMVISDAHLCQQLKQLRHDLTAAVATLDNEKRLAARDSETDVGRQIQTDSEYQRAPSQSNQPTSPLVQANLARVQQSLRSIEEFSKTVDVGVAKAVEQLRYRTYTLEKAILTTVLSLKNLSESKLYVLIDAGQPEEQAGLLPVEAGQGSLDFQPLINLTRELVDAGVSLIQLRDKRLNDRQLVLAGRAVAAQTRGTSTRFIMNDRADLALSSGADGVHLGQDDISVSDARKILGAARLIGVSTHCIQQARNAVLEGANYIGVGPVFHSQTKSFKAQVGLELVRAVSAEIQLPAFAIGGIDLSNVDQIVEAGLSRVAVSGAITRSQQPGSTARQLMQRLGG